MKLSMIVLLRSGDELGEHSSRMRLGASAQDAVKEGKLLSDLLGPFCLTMPYYALLCLTMPYYALLCLTMPYYALLCLTDRTMTTLHNVCLALVLNLNCV